MNQQPDDQPTDLDVVVDDVGGTDADRALDAELSRLLRISTADARRPLPGDDLSLALVGVKERGLRRRRRYRARRTALAAAAAAVVVAATGVVVHERTTPTPLLPATGTSFTLRPEAPQLPAEEDQRLRALPEFSGLLPRGENTGYLDSPFSRWAAPVDCAVAARWAGLPVPVLTGLDTSGLTQVCASDDPQALAGGTFAVAASGTRPGLYRFYLPEGLDLARVTPRDATASGVSWTSVVPVTAQEVTDQRELPHDTDGRATTVTRTRGDLALVSRLRHGGTGVDWFEEVGGAPVAAGAVLAADPVTAVRATLDPHPCDGAFSLTPAGSSGGALTAEGALQAWLDDDDDHSEGAGSQGAPPTGWVVVEERDEQKTFASGDWRVTVYQLGPSSWMVTGKSCAEPEVLPPPS